MNRPKGHAVVLPPSHSLLKIHTTLEEQNHVEKQSTVLNPTKFGQGNTKNRNVLFRYLYKKGVTWWSLWKYNMIFTFSVTLGDDIRMYKIYKNQ